MSLIVQSAVEAATPALLAQGIRVFNGALFGADEEQHVAVLLEVLDPPADAMVIDAGCGVGEMARLMHEARPDLQFLLVNTIQAQLDECPPQFERLLADFDDLAVLPNHCADAVVFSYSLCHSADWPTTLREARRVLKDGGVLLVNDMARLAGNNDGFELVLGAQAHAPEAVESWARDAGFAMDTAIAPTVQVDRLRDVMTADGIGTEMLDGVVPTIWRFTALDADAAMWHRHAGHIGFQFSGGRDSTAALYVLRDHWRDMSVYHLDTGDQFPETRAVVAAVERDLAAAGVTLQRIVTDVKSAREVHGYPSDLIPVDNTPLGQLVSGSAVRLTGRYDCCAANLMGPMHARMVQDGITLLVRGQRDDEYATPPMRSGQVVDGFEVHYPIQDWSGDEVQRYLEGSELPLAPFYAAGARRAPECMGCTAWWDEGRAAYLQQHHPAEHAVFIQRMADIRAQIDRSMFWLNHETEA